MLLTGLLRMLLPDTKKVLMQINGKTRIVGVLGHPIFHTASPAMHNAAFEALGLNWCYVALDVEPSHLGVALRGLAAAGLVGVNLTVPHKILAVRYLDQASLEVQHSKAANTLLFSYKNNKPFLRGYNTDGYGLLKALKEAFSFQARDKRIAIIGCGGAGQGAAIQLALAGAKKLILLNRTRSKALMLARRIQSLGAETICGFTHEPCDLIVQATSLGLKKSDPLPVSWSELQRLRAPIFFDMIYRPAETPAMRAAKKIGCNVENGLGMLLYQGARAFEIWTGRQAPLKIMRRALQKEIDRK